MQIEKDKKYTAEKNLEVEKLLKIIEELKVEICGLKNIVKEKDLCFGQLE
jgi:hypothetical protein